MSTKRASCELSAVVAEDGPVKKTRVGEADAELGVGGVQLVEKAGNGEAGKGVGLPRKLVAEFVGTMLLVAAMVGSGIQGESLAEGNAAVALIGHTIASWGMFFVLINVFGPVSGAHINPVVSLATAIRGQMSLLQLAAYSTVQIVGGIFGTLLSHGIFIADEAAAVDGADRTSGGEFAGEVVATFVLLITLFGTKKPHGPMAVGLAILAGYWYTSSFSFANPAVTIARSFTNTFASIHPRSVPVFIAGQIVGLAFAIPFTHVIIEGRSIY